ncbi:MAG: RHS repeat-associated core domain-containing protein, partial [Anaerolineae bacterium]
TLTYGPTTYCYDQNGNLRRQIIGGEKVFWFDYDAENHLTEISGDDAATFVYDADGQRVKASFGSAPNITIVAYAGNHFEQRTVGSVVSTVKTYFAGGVRVAMRTQTGASDVLHWLMSDALGSTTTATGANGELVASTFYEAWGESIPVVGDLPTARRFTGQTHDPVIAGIYYYGARYYDPALGRFLQADTIVPNPQNPQSLNRYSNVLNNPVKYRDPSGHIPCYGDAPDECSWAGYKDQPAGARRHSLRGYARFLEKQVQKNGMTALDAMTDLWGFASLYGKDAVTTSEDVSYTLVGSGGTMTLLGGFILKGQEFLGGAPLNLPNFGDTGFHLNYRDRHNQPYHFWANVNTTAQGGNLGEGIGLVANVVHEMADPSEALKPPQERGTSWEDYFLSLKGLEMGQMLHSGALTVDQAGSWMQANLSAPVEPAYDFWKSTGTGWWPSVWMQQAVDLFR